MLLTIIIQCYKQIIRHKYVYNALKNTGIIESVTKMSLWLIFPPIEGVYGEGGVDPWLSAKIVLKYL